MNKTTFDVQISMDGVIYDVFYTTEGDNEIVVETVKVNGTDLFGFIDAVDGWEKITEMVHEEFEDQRRWYDRHGDI